jgi:hypothetical protein
MTNNTEADAARVKEARKLLCNLAWLDQYRKGLSWDASCERALQDVQAKLAAMPSRIVVEAVRAQRQGGPQSTRPQSITEPTRDTGERSRRPRHGEDGLYDRADMRARRA